jgi:hypothetical protein
VSYLWTTDILYRSNGAWCTPARHVQFPIQQNISKRLPFDSGLDHVKGEIFEFLFLEIGMKAARII